MDQSSKCLNYIIFKSYLKLEQYLTNLRYSQRVWMTRFRCRNHKLPIEAGCRHGVSRENRIYTHCNMKVGSEFHYLFECSHFNDIQKRLLNCFYSQAPNSLKFELLMNVQYSVDLENLCTYVKNIMKTLIKYNQVNSKHLCSLCAMLDQRRRHWAGVVHILCGCFVFAGNVIIISQGKLAKNLKQIPYQNIFVPRSCIRSGLATQNLFTPDIHRRIFRRVKSKIADDLT